LEEGDEEHGHAYRSRASGREHESVAVLLARHTYEGYGKRDEMVEERKVRRGSTRRGKWEEKGLEISVGNVSKRSEWKVTGDRYIRDKSVCLAVQKAVTLKMRTSER
jgi:hypothetical protein